MAYRQSCIDASKALYNILEERFSSNLEIIKLGVVLKERYEWSDCFRVRFNNPRNGVHEISIAYPTDAIGNRGPKRGDPEIPIWIETALINESDYLFYPEEIGYYDVRRFSSPDEIIEEILRVGNFVVNQES